ncbi:hypothetical protein BpHYR1_003853 [Brachionus plicatilis]|uniref:Uncharacterized protein n=1 Tax=Brachionus plicatilis TaxID=10195 RepID=A0A3M7PA33_BRAPC|nr:hypothetical protein BpHYR1_003853 [Brachionus plicatilis]
MKNFNYFLSLNHAESYSLALSLNSLIICLQEFHSLNRIRRPLFGVLSSISLMIIKSKKNKIKTIKMDKFLFSILLIIKQLLCWFPFLIIKTETRLFFTDPVSYLDAEKYLMPYNNQRININRAYKNNICFEGNPQAVEDKNSKNELLENTTSIFFNTKGNMRIYHFI